MRAQGLQRFVLDQFTVIQLVDLALQLHFQVSHLVQLRLVRELHSLVKVCLLHLWHIFQPNGLFFAQWYHQSQHVVAPGPPLPDFGKVARRRRQLNLDVVFLVELLQSALYANPEFSPRLHLHEVLSASLDGQPRHGALRALFCHRPHHFQFCGAHHASQGHVPRTLR